MSRSRPDYGWRMRVAPFALLLLANLAYAQPAIPEGSRGELGEALDMFVSRYEPFGFSGQVLVAVGDTVVLHRAYGMADRGSRRPMTTETAIGVASVTKQFTAAAAFVLAQEGRLSLDDPLEHWLEGVPEDKRGITIDQLLTHTAAVSVGLAEDFEAATLEEQVAAILAAPLTGRVGERWRYSNGGYILAASIIQKVAGQPFGDFLRQALFEPAGMMHSGLLYAPPAEWPMARAYVGWEDKGGPGEWPLNPRAFGSGDVITTAADLWQWERALRAGRILSDAWLEKYFSAQVDAGENAGYAYGMFVHEGERGRVVEHGGDTRIGYNAGFFRYRDRDAVLIVTSNSALAPGRWMRHTLSADLEKMLFGEEVGIAPPVARILEREEADRLAGTWSFEGGDRLHLIDDGTHLWVAAEGQGATDLLHAAESGDHAIANANRRTRALLHGLLTGDDEAYPRALTEDGVPHLQGYVDEWERLTATLGPLEGFAVLGSVPFPRDVVTTARATFRDGQVAMRYFWSDSGRGRLHGTHADAGPGFPVSTPVAIAPDGSLVIHDPWRETTLRARRTPHGQGSRLVFDSGASATGPSLVLWTPAGR
jgi:CubicO group peptidase (beta-lactamase class C family)